MRKLLLCLWLFGWTALAAHSAEKAPGVRLSDYAFKFANYVCFWANPGETVPVTLINDYQEKRDWETDVYFQVFNRRGTLAGCTIPARQRRTVTVVGEGDIIVVFMTSRRCHHRVDIGERPWAFVGFQQKGAIDVVSPHTPERLYFRMPKDKKALDLRATFLPEDSHTYIAGPDGKNLLDFWNHRTGTLSPHQILQPPF